MRIATWNIAGARTSRSVEKFDYHEDENREYFIELLANVKPDIVCLQEAHGNDDFSLARFFARKLKLPYVFNQPTCPSHIDSRYMLCNAILSRVPFDTPRTTLLPRPRFKLYLDDREVQPYDRYLVNVQFADFRIATMHVEPLPILGYRYGAGEGLKFAHEIDKVITKAMAGSSSFIFAGDLYAGQLKLVYPKLMRQFSLQDALPAGAPTTPEGDADDHIAYTSDWRLIKTQIIPTESDHYLCVADLEKN